MVGTAGLPHVIVRFYTVRKVSSARLSAGFALVFIALLYTTAPAVAAFARTNLIEQVSNRQYSEVPEWFSNWEDTGLIKFDDKNGDGIIQYVGPDDPRENELTIDRDIMVLANPEIAALPAWVIGLVAAGALAAALSTAAGLLLVISSAVAHDLLKKWLRPDITERQELRVARISAGVAVCIAGYFGIHPPGFVAQVVAFAFGLAAASFFPAIVLGIFSKRVGTVPAMVGMVAGIGVVGMLLNFGLTIALTPFFPAPSPAVRAMIESIHEPEGAEAALVIESKPPGSWCGYSWAGGRDSAPRVPVSSWSGSSIQPPPTDL
jgi:cation/acetate symporter